MAKSNVPDQYYTKPTVANELLTWLWQQMLPKSDKYLEPAAGDGSFSSLLPENKTEAIDLLPLSANVKQQDFMEYYPQPGFSYMVIGNPPFGKNSSLAIRFFNRSANFAEAIAFIVPRTFKKHSVIGRLHPFFHLLAEREVPKNAFLENGKEKDVPTLFQVWVKQKTPRVVSHTLPKESDFIFVSKQDSPDFSIQRVGANAGKIRTEFDDRAAASHYFVRAKEANLKKKVQKTLEAIDWQEVKSNSAGNPSISKRELLELYSKQRVAESFKKK